MQAGISVPVDCGHHLRDCPVALPQALDNCTLTHLSMRLQSSNKRQWLQHRAAMAGQIGLVITGKQPVERMHEIGHCAIRRCNNCRRPRHHMIGGKQNAAPLKRKRDMVCTMARCVDGAHRPSVPDDQFIIRQPDIRFEIRVRTFLKRVHFAQSHRPR